MKNNNFKSGFLNHIHGGDIYSAAQCLNIPEKEIIDFSASINPLGVPKSAISAIKDNARYLYNYPDPDAKKLSMHIAELHKINPESIICGNGSTELIYLVARTLRPERVLIPAPTFSEYERAYKISCKLRVESYRLKQENDFDIDPDKFIQKMKGCDAAFLCNPNNPTGRVLKKADAKKIADASTKLKCYLIIDEAFIDFVPEESVIKEVAKNPYLIVLRSLTKFYALSGLRLGYGVFPLSITETIKKDKEPWTVNTLAQTAGIAAFKDSVFKKKTFRVIKQEKEFLEKEFKRLEISYIPSEANYYLLRLNHAKEIVSALRNRGILVRDCSNFRGLDSSYIRVAVKSRKSNMRLIEELGELCEA